MLVEDLVPEFGREEWGGRHELRGELRYNKFGAYYIFSLSKIDSDSLGKH